ncbi:shikimate dehydrogenase [Micrococcoides hystricis]|uniref:Shikimate dehydrogenase n=1 Tax=Micrococcoides hystricis TaxID=1572761 RepID=A0ABV6PCG4_9MICC
MHQHRIRIGLIGNDLSTSLSPQIHEREAVHQGLDGYRYELLDLEDQPEVAKDLGAFIAAKLAAGYTGFNVTHPYKQVVMQHLDALSPAVEALGAVNTIVLREDGTLLGENTDYTGFLTALQRNMSDCPRERVVLIGAGGAGSAVARALADFGVGRLDIVDPDQDRREQLREKIAQTQTEAAAWEPTALPDLLAAADGVVNATPIGMENIPGTPLDLNLLEQRHWVGDVIYRPIETELLKHAASLGCRRLDGTQMLIEQAGDGFRLLTGVEPDVQRMRAELQQSLQHSRSGEGS